MLNILCTLAEDGVQQLSNGRFTVFFLIVGYFVKASGHPFIHRVSQAILNAENNPKIKPIVERIEAEKASKKANVDTDAMLGELEG